MKGGGRMPLLAGELELDISSYYPGLRLALLDINSLLIDQSYQRPKTDLINAIAEHFDPLAYGSALVAERPDGKRYLVDAQQRTAGAKKAGKKMVPVVIFRSEGREQESRIFRYINSFRKAVSVMDIFRACVVEKEPQTVSIQKTVTDAGFKIALKKGMEEWPYISAIEQLKNIHGKIGSQNGPEELSATLNIIMSLWKGQTEALRREVIRGTHTFYMAFGNTLDYVRLTDRFTDVTVKTLLLRADKEKSEAKQRGHRQHLYQCFFSVIRAQYGKKVPPISEAWPPLKK